MNSLLPFWIIVAPALMVIIDLSRTPKVDSRRHTGDSQVPMTAAYTPMPLATQR